MQKKAKKGTGAYVYCCGGKDEVFGEKGMKNREEGVRRQCGNGTKIRKEGEIVR